MIKSLKLTNFKNFREATLPLGKLTLLVGTNASGKTNLIDAFRFLHGIGRGYSLADVIGEKWGEGGYLEWPGIRGGSREIAHRDAHEFKLELDLDDPAETYGIAVEVGGNGLPPALISESFDTRRHWKFESLGPPRSHRFRANEPIAVRIFTRDASKAEKRECNRFQPVLSQLRDKPAIRLRHLLESMRFFDLSADALRRPSSPGQDVLGSRGENLASTLLAICADKRLKRAALSWIEALTPVDVVDFEFVDVGRGEISLNLVESGGQKTSVYSASDGTLKFLGMIAAVLGPKPSKFYSFEEIENAIHPTRLHLLVELLEQQVSRQGIQILATTHAPQVLGFLSPESRESAVLTYRLPERSAACVRRILDIPEARTVLERQDLARLHASGWLENSVAFLEGAEQPA